MEKTKEDNGQEIDKGASAQGTATMAPPPDVEHWQDHWKVFVACGIMVLSPFQYGVDFGLIGGLQAMVGFLEVCHL